MFIGVIVAWFGASVVWWLWAPDPLRIRGMAFGVAVLWALLVLTVVWLDPRSFASESLWRNGGYLRHIRVFFDVGIPWALIPWVIVVATRFTLTAVARLR